MTTLEVSRPLDLLKACPAYVPTPLVEVTFAGVGPVLIKDESKRMGLGAFKALGGVYAVARLLEQRFGATISPADFTSEEIRDFASGFTFVCASAGNHGLAVAAGAQLFGAKSRIYLAHTVPAGFDEKLEAKGATVVRAGDDYQASVDAALADAEETGGIFLADASWPGYIEPPRLVMEGYTVMAEEMRQQLEATGDWPTRVYLQAGVGGFAGGVAYGIRELWPVQPEIIVVEPDAADCLRASVDAGKVVTVTGPDSNMGRLDCKTPSTIALEILSSAADRFVTVTDAEAQAAAQTSGQVGYPSTPSGAAGLAALLIDKPQERSLIIVSEGSV